MYPLINKAQPILLIPLQEITLVGLQVPIQTIVINIKDVKQILSPYPKV